MAVNNILPLREQSFGQIGTRKYKVAANSSGTGTGTSYVPAFRSGEPVIRALGGYVVTPLYTTSASSEAGPVVATHRVVGVAASTSTETDTAVGYVEIIPNVPGQVWLIGPETAATYGVSSTPVQATYDLLVGDRVLIDLAAGSYCAGEYTLLAADGATYGCVVMPLDVTRYPGKVAFSFREDSTDLHA
jgi:hypothetical protein